MAWSPDSRSLCGVVQLPNGETALVVQSLQLPEAEQGGNPVGIRLLSVGRNTNQDVAWHPSGRRVVFTAFSAPIGRFQMFEFDPTKNSLPSLVAGQTATINSDLCWSADAKTLVYVAQFTIRKNEPDEAADRSRKTIAAIPAFACRVRAPTASAATRRFLLHNTSAELGQQQTGREAELRSTGARGYYRVATRNRRTMSSAYRVSTP